ncbi:MAG: cytochrome bc complex cytochrome b subunit [Chloroflexi bacterium]|nr:cytochrome bc complex cytochrome b subunit [Chloroflexota bacterium]MDL1885540.1 cytochrome bc complex cytochrome b subunit [Anaerolineae bacterium CFX8]
MSVLPFPSFLDDVKEKGLKRAVFELVDESVERLTAGMNIQDVREALRGEAPSRKPNPRLQPHADGFWLHMRPSYFHSDMTGLYPTFRLGWLSTYFVFFETITGILLMVWYTPSPEVAYHDMINMLTNVPLGQLMRDLHRLGAEAMVLIVALHMVRTWVTGSYKKPRQFTWFTGLILLVITGFLSFTGYLLPWDQLALWAVTIGASMIEATPPPVVGENLNLLIRGGPEIGANGLLRFYLLHVLALPALLFVFTGVHYYKVIVHGHSLPPQKENIGEDTAKRVPLDRRVYFIPDVLTSELLWVGVTTLILVVLCIWFYDAPLEHHADPQVTPLGTTAPWYFLWIQGALKLGDKVFWGLIFPGALLGVMAVWPYIDVTPSRRYAHRRFALTLILLLISFVTILSYMGLPEFGVVTAPDTSIIHELTYPPAHNHMGKLLPVPYDQLVPGMYTTREFSDEATSLSDFNQEIETLMAPTADGRMQSIEANLLDELQNQDYLVVTNLNFVPVPGDAPALRSVMEEFAAMIKKHDKELVNAWGGIIITQNQADLKRVDVIVSWDTVEIDNGRPVLDADGSPVLVRDANGNVVRSQNIQHIFIHRDGGYFSN